MDLIVEAVSALAWLGIDTAPTKTANNAAFAKRREYFILILPLLTTPTNRMSQLKIREATIWKKLTVALIEESDGLLHELALIFLVRGLSS